MNRKIAASALAMTALAGCNPSRSDLRQKADQVTATVFNTNAPRPGRVLEPNYCKVDSAIVSRPVGDKVVDASLWNIADEQAVPVELRQALEANGLRVGVITGSLPVDVLEAFKPSPPQKETQWVHIALPEGEHTPIALGGKTESVTLLLNHQGKVDGRDYHDASGRLILTPGHHGPKGVTLRLVPEIHHGQNRRTIAPLQNAGPFAPQEFAIKDGQQEDILRELTTSIDVQPGQTVVIGCRPEQDPEPGDVPVHPARAQQRPDAPERPAPPGDPEQGRRGRPTRSSTSRPSCPTSPSRPDRCPRRIRGRPGPMPPANMEGPRRWNGNWDPGAEPVARPAASTKRWVAHARHDVPAPHRAVGRPWAGRHGRHRGGDRAGLATDHAGRVERRRAGARSSGPR